LDIKKVKVNKVSQNYFKEILTEDILKSPEINSSHIIGKFITYEKMIRDSIEEASADFTRPAKFSGMNAYKFPYRMEVFRGSIIWNELYFDEVILPMDAVKIIKLKAETEEIFNKIIVDNEEFFSDEDLETLDKIKDFVFKDEELGHYGFTRFCIPNTKNAFPKYLIPFVDVDVIVDDNVRSALILLQSIGLETLEVKGINRYSNIIKF